MSPGGSAGVPAGPGLVPRKSRGSVAGSAGGLGMTEYIYEYMDSTIHIRFDPRTGKWQWRIAWLRMRGEARSKEIAVAEAKAFIYESINGPGQSLPETN